MSIQPNPIGQSRVEGNGVSSPNSQAAQLGELDQKIKEAIPQSISHPVEDIPGKQKDISFSATAIDASEEVVETAHDLGIDIIKPNVSDSSNTQSKAQDLLNASNFNNEEPISNSSQELGEETEEFDLSDEELDEFNLADLSDEELAAMEAEINGLIELEDQQLTEEQSALEQDLEEYKMTNEQNKELTTSYKEETNKSKPTEKFETVISEVKGKNLAGMDQENLDILKNEIDQQIAKHPDAKIPLEKLKQNIIDQENKGMPPNDILRGIKFEGRSLSDMNSEEFDNFLENLHENIHSVTYDYSFYKKSEEDESKTERDKHAQRPNDNQKTDVKSKDDKPKTDMTNIVVERFIRDAVLSQQMAKNQFGKSMEKIDAYVEKKRELLNESVRKQEIEKTDLKNTNIKHDASSFERQHKEISDQAALIKDAKNLISTVSHPVKRESLKQIISTIRQVESLPGAKTDVVLKNLQKALISFYKEITQATGTNTVSGKGSANHIIDT